MSNSTSGERLTAAISTVVAVAILGAAVAAQQARAPAGDRLARLESDLRFQLELAFNTDPNEYRTRVGALEQTLDAWRRAPQSADDYRVLVVWFRDAIVSSMPGRVSPMPATPEFGPQPPLVAEEPTNQPQRQASLVGPESTPQQTPATAQDSPATPPVVVVRQPTADAPARRPEPTLADAAPVPTIDDAPQPTPPAHSIPLAPAPTALETSDAYRPQADFVAAPAVLVNVAELNARIRGYHQGLAEVEAAFVVGGEVDGLQLARRVAQLERLAGQYRFVRLYYGALTAAERRAVAAPRSMAETVRLVQRHVARDASGDFLNDFDARAGSIRTLSERLRALAATTDQTD